MTMLITGIILLFSSAGIVVSAILLKNRKKARIACTVLCSVLAFASAMFIAVTLYFGWAVANQPADEDGTLGADWRTWRSYTADFSIQEGVTVCLSVLDDGSGYAVYDSLSGERVGTLEGCTVDGSEQILCEDIDGDGVSELGISISGETIWYRYNGNPWIEGEGGGCFEGIS